MECLYVNLIMMVAAGLQNFRQCELQRIFLGNLNRCLSSLLNVEIIFCFFFPFQSLQSELHRGHSFLKSLREQAEQAAGFLDEAGAESLGSEVEGRLAQLEELAGGLRHEHSFLERALLLAKEFQDRYKGQAQWLVETQALLNTPVEPKAELYQRRAQLAKYKVKHPCHFSFLNQSAE